MSTRGKKKQKKRAEKAEQQTKQKRRKEAQGSENASLLVLVLVLAPALLSEPEPETDAKTPNGKRAVNFPASFASRLLLSTPSCHPVILSPWSPTAAYIRRCTEVQLFSARPSGFHSQGRTAKSSGTDEDAKHKPQTTNRKQGAQKQTHKTEEEEKRQEQC